MGTTDSTTYAVEYKWNTNEWQVVASGFDSKHTAEIYILGRAQNQGTRASDYRTVPCGVKAKPTPVKGDMKEGLTNGKPQLSQLPHAALVYAARGFEYGCSPNKYERGNYLRPQVDMLADFHRLLFYADAVLRHATKLTTEMNRVLGCTDKTKEDLLKGVNTVDIESNLSHLTGMLANGMMAVQQAVDAGLIPADPGQPWLNKISK